MSAPCEDFTTPTFETLKTERMRWKDGRELVVSLTRSPAGHAAVDVREHITEDAYPSDAVGGSMRKPRRNARTKADGYVGPTRNGWWIVNPGTLLDMADAMARMAIELEAIQNEEES